MTPLAFRAALTRLGHAQAAAVAARFSGWPIQRVLSSQSLRFRETVVPLARDLSVDVEPCPDLTATARLRDLLRLLADPETASAVVCTHRETLRMLLAHLAEAGVAREGVSPMEMAATWILYGTVGGPAPVRLEYLTAAEAVPVSLLADVREESAAGRVSGSW